MNGIKQIVEWKLFERRSRTAAAAVVAVAVARIGWNGMKIPQWQ